MEESRRKELIAQREYVRALARRLVLDPDKGDDVAQDALLAALEAERPKGPIRRWLSGVVRNLAYRMLRSEDRRRRREARRARPDRGRPAGDVVADLELHREVVDALLALDEPYRTTLLLHFFEDLKPKEIAERQGIPGATVRSHLSRGLERLRRSLDERRSGWFVALLPFAFPARADAPLSGAAGVAVMSAKTKLSLAAVALLLLAMVPVASYWSARSASRESVHRAESPHRATEVEESEGAGGTEAAPQLAVEIRVLGPGDAPVPDASVLVFLGSQREWPLGFGSTGLAWFQLDWSKATDEPAPSLVRKTDALGLARLDVAPGKSYRVEARKAGYSRGETSLYYLNEAPKKPYVIRLSPAHALSGKVLDASGQPVAGATVAVGARDFSVGNDFTILPDRVAADGQGQYAFDSLASGDVSLWASPPGGIPGFVACVRIPDIGKFDIVLEATGTLAGKVTEKGTGRPVKGIEVRAKIGWNSPSFGRARTNEEGRYEIRGLAPGRIGGVYASGPGYVVDAPSGPEWIVASIVALETTALDLEVQRTGAIHGTVRGPEGPLPGVLVEAMCRIRNEYAIFQGKTDAQGAYRIADLPPASYLVRAATPTLHEPGDNEMFFQAFEPGKEGRLVKLPAGGEAEKSFALEGGSGVVEGRVEDGNGVGLSGAKVGAIGTSTVTGPSGDFRLEGSVPGDHVSLNATLDGYRVDGFAFVPLKPHETVKGVLIRLVPATKREVRGRVHPAPEAPLREPYLLVKRVEEENPMWRGSDGPARHAVAADGTFAVELTEYAVRLKAVELRAGGLGAGLSAPVRIDLGDATRYDADLHLSPALILKGSVVGEDGAPVPAACVSVIAPKPRNFDDQFRNSHATAPVVAVSDEHGLFEAKGLGAGKYEYRAWARGSIDAVGTIDVPPGPLNITLEKALELAGRVSTRDGKPVARASMHVQLPMPARVDPDEWWRTKRFHDIFSVSTNDRGEFRLGGLKRGDYTITIEGGRGGPNVCSKTFQGVPAGSTDLALVVEPGLSIRGRIVDRSGSGVGQAYVQTRVRFKDDPSHTAWIGPDGSFELQGLEPGTYTVTAHIRRGTVSRQTTREVVAGATGVVIEVDDTVAPISGTLVDGEGKPLTGVRLRLRDGEMSTEIRALSDGAGRFTFEGAADREYRVEFDYGETRYERLLLEGGERVKGGATDVKLRLHEGAAVEGIVRDEAGAPLPGIWVGVMTGDRWRAADTDALGRFRVVGLPADTEAQMHVAPHDGKEFAIHLRTVRTGAQGVAVTLLRTTRTTGRVVDAAGRPLAKFPLAFAPVEGYDTKGWGVVTDDDGRFEVRLLVRDYRVTAKRAGDESPPLDCGTLRGGAADVTLTAK